MPSHDGLVPGQGKIISKFVWYTGSDALDQGVGLCYDADRAVVAGYEADRTRYVERPNQTNNRNFAGWTTAPHAAKVGGQSIEIAEPGSDCKVSMLVATTANVGAHTVTLGAGGCGCSGIYGFQGRGTVRPLETRAAVASNLIANGVVAASIDGTGAIAADGITITAAGVFTNAAIGDFVYVVGGSVTATGVTPVTVGRYRLASVTNLNVAVLDTVICAADSIIHFYVVRGNVLVLCRTEEGPESGLLEFITPDSATATPAMVTGKTILCGGFDLDVSSTDTLADGDTLGLRKAFIEHGAISTGDHVITVTTGLCINPAGADEDNSYEALASITLDGDADAIVLEWTLNGWVPVCFTQNQTMLA